MKLSVRTHRFLFTCLPALAALLLLSPAIAQRLPAAAMLKKWDANTIGLAGTPSRLFTDRKGLLWIGSTAGLACFDGKAFKTYTEEDGLAGNFITDIEAAPDGVLYVATQHGVSRYTGRAGKPFERLAGMEGLFFITCILPLSHDTLLLGDIGHYGLHKWTNGRIDEPYPGIATENVVDDLYRSGRGTVFLAQQDNLFIIRGGRKDSTTLATNGKRWATVVPGAAGTVWCAAANLYHAEEYGRMTDSLDMPPSDPTVLNRVVAAPDGRLLIANNGLWRYNPAGRRWDTMVSPGSLGGPVAFALAADSGMVWICGRFGLARIYTPPALAGISAAAAGTFITDGAGLPAVTTGRADDAAIARQAPGAVIRQVYRDKTGRSWYLSSDGVYWREGGALKHYSPPYEAAAPGVVFNTALEDAAGNIWFGTGRGMLRYDGRQFFTPLPINKVHNGEKFSYIPEVSTFSLIRGKGGRMFGACREIFYIASPDMQIRENKNLDESVSINCTGLAGSSAGDIWAILDGHLRGMADYTDKGGDLEVVDSLPAVGIPGMAVALQDLVFDGDNNLWVLGSRALSVYLRQPGARPYSAARRYLFTANDLPGLLTGDVAEMIQRDTAGNILIGHEGQTYRLNAATLIASATHMPPPLLSFSALLQNGRPMDWPTAAPRFSDSVRSLAFHFTATAPLNAEYITYAYRLAGYSDAWSSNGSSGEISFTTGLPAGEYRLEVRAADLNGRQSNIISVPFSILPPWYRTGWAWAVWIALAAAAILGLFRLRLRAVRRKARVEQLVVEHELKALRAQINPHFLQNTFAFLVNTLEEQPVHYSVEVINQLSAYLRNVLYRSDAPVVNMEDELAFAEEYLAMNQLLLGNAFTYKTRLEDGLDTYNIRLPSMLLQPLLENAIKHGRAERGGRPFEISISVYADDRYVYCAISNPAAPGKGRPQQPGYLPRGLELTKQRLGLLYREADITAGEDAGIYQVVVRLPLLHYKEAVLSTADADTP